MNALWLVVTLAGLHGYGRQALPLNDKYVGKYVGTFTPNGATQAAASAVVSSLGAAGYQILLTSRPGGLHPNGLQWRDGDLSGAIHQGHFHAAFVAGQVVEPVTFSGDRLIAVVQGSSGGAFILHKVKP